MRERQRHNALRLLPMLAGLVLVLTARVSCADVETAEAAHPVNTTVALAGTAVDRRVLQAIRHASQTTGVALPYLLAKAYRESGFDVHADAAASSAAGIFQFTRQTWLELFRRHGETYGYADLVPLIRRSSRGYLYVPKSDDGELILNLRHNPVLASQLAAEYTRENSQQLRRSLKRVITPEELYIAHFMGAQGAVQLLRAAELRPDVAAAKLFPEAAASNPNLFYSYPQRKEISVSALCRRLIRSFRRELNRFAEPASKFSAAIAPLMDDPLMHASPRKPEEFRQKGATAWTKEDVETALQTAMRPVRDGLPRWLRTSPGDDMPIRRYMGPGHLATLVVQQALQAEEVFIPYPDAPVLAISGWREETPTLPPTLENLPMSMEQTVLLFTVKDFMRVSGARISGELPPWQLGQRVAGGAVPRYDEDETDTSRIITADATGAELRPDV